MSNLINFQKPLFEYTDLELKAIAFDESQLIRIHERNVNLILSELERRSASKVVTSVSDDKFKSIVK
jgi:hypothetical protein